MIEKILYLSSIEPTVLAFTYPSLYNINFEDKTTCIVPMVKNNDDIKYIVAIPMIKEDAPYVSTIWDRDNNAISWERNYIQRSAAGETTTIYYSNIKIKYHNPSYFYIQRKTNLLQKT